MDAPGSDATGADAPGADATVEVPDATGPDPEDGPGWSMNRVAAVMMTGIAAGAGIGVAIFEMIALAGIGAGMLRGGVLPTGSGLWLFVVGVAVAGATGAVVATAAAVGTIVALVLFDHWGERPTLSRAVIGGLGAAAGAAVLTLVYGSGVSATAGAWGSRGRRPGLRSARRRGPVPV